MVSKLAAETALPTLVGVQGQAELEDPVAAALSSDFAALAPSPERDPRAESLPEAWS